MKAANPDAKPDEPVFTTKAKNRIPGNALKKCWWGDTRAKGFAPGIVMQLAQEGKIRRYLKPYCTRHTYITAAVFEHGLSPDAVARLCGTSVKMIYAHYFEQPEALISPDLSKPPVRSR